MDKYRNWEKVSDDLKHKINQTTDNLMSNIATFMKEGQEELIDKAFQDKDFMPVFTFNQCVVKNLAREMIITVSKIHEKCGLINDDKIIESAFNTIKEIHEEVIHELKKGGKK